MIRIEIENTLGIKRAVLDLEPGQVTEVIGVNASGKSSIAVAATAVLGQTADPLGLPAAMTRTAYVREGAEVSRVSALYDDGLEVLWEPQRAAITAPTGLHPVRLDVLGGVDFTQRGGGDARLKALHAALLPPLAEIIEAVRKDLGQHLHGDDINGVVEMLKRSGWDETASVYADRARVSKRQWSDVTTRTYGVRVAADWRPDGWLAELDELTVQSAEAAVVDARDALNALVRVHAVGEAEVVAARAARDRLPGMCEALEVTESAAMRVRTEWAKVPLAAARLRVDEAHARLGVLRQERDRLPHALPHACPHCGGYILVKDDGLLRHDETAISRRLEEIEAEGVKANGEIDRAEAAYEPLKAEAARIDAEHTSLSRDADRLQGEIAAAERQARLADAEIETGRQGDRRRCCRGCSGARERHREARRRADPRCSAPRDRHALYRRGAHARTFRRPCAHAEQGHGAAAGRTRRADEGQRVAGSGDRL